MEHPCGRHSERVVADVFNHRLTESREAERPFGARIFQPCMNLSSKDANVSERFGGELGVNNEGHASNDCDNPSTLFDALTSQLRANGALPAFDSKRFVFDPRDALRAVGQGAPINVPNHIIQDFSRSIAVGVL